MIFESYRVKLSTKLDRIKVPLRSFYKWVRGSFERTAIFSVVLGSAVVCALLLLVPTSSSGGEADEHGHEHEEEENELAIELEEDVLEKAGMTLDQAKPATITPTISVRGQIFENSNKAMNIKPRFGGLVRSVFKDFGDQVKKGEPLLSIESAVTRSSYVIRTVIDGIVADKRVVAGAFVPENESIFRIVDLSSVWFQARVSIRDADKLKIGLMANVKDRLLEVEGKGVILNVSPVVDEDTQSCDVRVQLENPNGAWRVGTFAEASLSLQPIDVKVAIKSSAVQELNGQTVIFKKQDEHLVAVPILTGTSDGEWSEVRSGLEVGDTYVVANSFLAKAELLKSSAEHEH